MESINIKCLNYLYFILENIIMKNALLILHQKKSIAGDIGIKLKKRGYNLIFCRPPLGQKLPTNLNKFSLVVIFGGPMSVNDTEEYIVNEINFMKLIIDSNIPYLGICLGAQFLAKYLGSSIQSNDNNSYEIGFYEIYPTINGNELFKNQSFFYQFHNEGFSNPKNCNILALGTNFKYQAFKYKKCYGLQFHPEVNFMMHLRWIFLVLMKKPSVFFTNGAQNIFYQIIFRFKYNKSISKWLDYFLDDYLLEDK